MSRFWSSLGNQCRFAHVLSASSCILYFLSSFIPLVLLFQVKYINYLKHFTFEVHKRWVLLIDMFLKKICSRPKRPFTHPPVVFVSQTTLEICGPVMKQREVCSLSFWKYYYFSNNKVTTVTVIYRCVVPQLFQCISWGLITEEPESQPHKHERKTCWRSTLM